MASEQLAFDSRGKIFLGGVVFGRAIAEGCRGFGRSYDGGKFRY